MYTLTLQRDSIQVGGNAGMLSIGEMPSGVSEDLDLGSYSRVSILVACSPRFAKRGMWCSFLVRCDALIMITGVSIYLGSSPRRHIPRRRKAPPINTLIAFHCPRQQCKSPPFTSHFTHPSSSLSCLQGNSILHGLADIVCNIQSKLGPNGRFPCSEPRTIAFSIGGKLFPVNLRHFHQENGLRS